MIKTSKEAIAQYWAEKHPEIGISPSVCWRCGIKKRLDRCHIKAASLNGSDSPENFVLLCKHCHIDSPNIENPEFMWLWLSFYNERDHHDLWYQRGVREFEMLFRTPLDPLIQAERPVFERLFAEELKKATRHFGQPSLNPATVAGVIWETLKRMNINTTP